MGQQAPLEEKKKWDPDFTKRKKIKAILTLCSRVFRPLGGATSIDVTKPGIDKAYGIRKLRDILDIAIAEMIFVGDAMFPGGNDYPAKQAGVVSIESGIRTRRSGSSKPSSLVWVEIVSVTLGEKRWLDFSYSVSAW